MSGECVLTKDDSSEITILSNENIDINSITYATTIDEMY
jgi:hypothetical protein